MKSINVNGSDKEYMSYLKQINSKSKVESKKSTLSLPKEPKSKSATVTLPDIARRFMGKNYKGTQVGYLSDSCCVCYSNGIYRLFITTPVKKQFVALKLTAHEIKGENTHCTKFSGDFKKKEFSWDFIDKECAKLFIEKQKAYDTARA